MTHDVLVTTAGILLLVVGGEMLVRGAASLAGRLGVSPLAIGLTVVAFGTSAPELFVNVTAALQGSSALSFGNIFGSNLANIGLIIAVTALVGPLRIHNVVIAREVPMMMLATLMAAVLGLDAFWSERSGSFDRGDGIVLLLLFSVFVYYTLRDLMRQRVGNGDPFAPVEPDEPPHHSVGVSVTLTVVGLAALCAGGVVTVQGAVGLARALGVSEAIIGLSLVAIGTSLPELVAAVIASMRGHPDMAVGNVVGSNIFNLLIVLGTTATITDVPVPPHGVIDLGIVVLLSAVLWRISVTQAQTIIRAEAAFLLLFYVLYIAYRTAV